MVRVGVHWGQTQIRLWGLIRDLESCLTLG